MRGKFTLLAALIIGPEARLGFALELAIYLNKSLTAADRPPCQPWFDQLRTNRLRPS